MAQATHASLDLLHAAAPEPDFVSYQAGPQSERDSRAAELRTEHEKLNAHAEALRDKGINSRAFLIQGSTIEVILQHINDSQAEMIIVGSHGHGGLYHLILGSVTSALLKKSSVPVIVIPCHIHS